MGTIVTASTHTNARRAAAPSRVAKAVIWVVVFSLALWYTWAYALRFLAPDPAARSAYPGPINALVLHIAASMVALLIGPLQFVTRLRGSRPRVHRVVGRVYLAAIAVAASSAFYVLIHRQRTLPFENGLTGLAWAWLLTSGMALWAIRLRQFDQHREWMIRSYVVTFGFVTFRVGYELFKAFGVGNHDQRVGTMAWFCWAGPLLVTEVVLQGRKLVAVRTRTASAGSSSAT